MQSMKAAALAAFFLLVMLSFAPWARAGDADLNSDYQGKVLTLRHFYEGTHLVFQTDGSLIGRAEIGPWTVDGEIFINTIEAKGRVLRIRGRRVCLVFDRRKEPGRDVLESLEETRVNNRDPDDLDKREGVFRAKDVDIDIRLDSENPDEEGVKSAMDRVFLAPSESMSDIVPDFWRGYFDEREGRPRTSGYTGVYYSVKKGEVSPPRRISGREPEFSEYARVGKFQGTMTVSLVVDPSGAARNVVIATPLGLGLDEKAVEAVRAWKFEPATKDGQPVAVAIMVEVDFHLY
jgi:TonB family protein